MASLRAGQEALQQMMQTVMDRQLTYIEQTARLEGIVTNGLSHRVKEICEKITTFCASYDARLQRLEQFAWFRDWVTKVRDDIFKNFFKLAVLGGLIYALVHFGDKLVKP